MKYIFFIFTIILYLITLHTLQAQVNLDSGQVIYLPFNGSANDESGNGNNGINHGASLTNDRFGNSGRAYSFDGINDYIEIPLSPNITMTTNSFTVTCWINTTTAPFQNDGIIGNFRYNANSIWSMSIHGDNSTHRGKFAFFLRDSTLTNVHIMTPSPMNDGNWHFLAGIRDTIQHKIIFKMDGYDVGEAPDTVFNVNSGQNIWVGEHLYRYFQGLIDDIRIYRRVLNATEIDSIYHEGGWALSFIKDIEEFPAKFYLMQNYPNPFNPTTTIEFDLHKTSNVALKIFNTLGEGVAILVSDRLTAGSYSYEWDASNMPSGVYLYSLEDGEYIETRKMILMR